MQVPRVRCRAHLETHLSEAVLATRRLSDDSLEFGRVWSGCFFENGDAVALSTAPPRLIALHAGSVPAYRLIGKRGNGPGEFQQPWTVECFGRDSLSVLEPFRITVGELGGQLRSRAVNASDGARWWDPIAREAGSLRVGRARRHTRRPRSSRIAAPRSRSQSRRAATRRGIARPYRGAGPSAPV